MTQISHSVASTVIENATNRPHITPHIQHSQCTMFTLQEKHTTRIFSSCITYLIHRSHLAHTIHIWNFTHSYFLGFLFVIHTVRFVTFPASLMIPSLSFSWVQMEQTIPASPLHLMEQETTSGLLFGIFNSFRAVMVNCGSEQTGLSHFRYKALLGRARFLWLDGWSLYRVWKRFFKMYMFRNRKQLSSHCCLNSC